MDKLAPFPSGVQEYVKCEAVIKVGFPVDDKGKAYTMCIYCPYLSSNNRMCQLNKQLVAFPDKYIGDNCPLYQVEEVKEDVQV